MPLSPATAARRRLMPLADEVGGPERWILATAFTLLAATILFAGLHSAVGLGGDGLEAPIRDYASSVAYILVAVIVWMRALRIRDARGPWLALAVGVTLYGAGNLVWALWLEHVAAPPIPSICDLLWLSLYPIAYGAVVRLGLRGIGRVPAGVWLDGLIVALGITAVGAAAVFRPVLDSATGSTVAVVTNLAYPIADLILAAVVLAVLVVRGWRLDASWALIGGGFLVLCGADSIYLRSVAAGAVESSLLANIFYMCAVALLAGAAWQRRTTVAAPSAARWSMLLVPGAASLGALGLLAVDHFAPLDPLAFSLALLTFIVSLGRTALTFRDVRTLSRTRKEALTDYLTELPNRRLFRTRLDDAIREAGVLGESCALLVIDVDRFKELNDTLGHHAGDLLLQQIGPRLHAAVRGSDTVARLGGDEFALVLRAPIDEQGAVRVAQTVRETMASAFVVGELSLHVAVSAGVALFPDHGTGAEEIMRRADVAMYRAKTLQTGREVYAGSWHADARDRLTLIGDLRDAIRAREIEVYFQPVAEAKGRRVIGVEALARWQHRVHGPIPPHVFIPMAEEAGFARDLTRQVLGRALDQCLRWRHSGIDLRVSVNLTAPDLHDSTLPEEVAAALSARGLPPEVLLLEVTETSVLTDPVRVGNVIARLGELGIGLSLDDFGTGYSSLTHLKTLPVGEVKIDRSFVADMATDPTDGAIVGSIIQLAHSLGMRVVAEGVEDEATWERLAALDCELVQGYVLSRPRPAEELEPALRTAPVLAG